MSIQKQEPKVLQSDSGPYIRELQQRAEDSGQEGASVELDESAEFYKLRIRNLGPVAGPVGGLIKDHGWLVSSRSARTDRLELIKEKE